MSLADDVCFFVNAYPSQAPPRTSWGATLASTCAFPLHTPSPLTLTVSVVSSGLSCFYHNHNSASVWCLATCAWWHVLLRWTAFSFLFIEISRGDRSLPDSGEVLWFSNARYGSSSFYLAFFNKRFTICTAFSAFPLLCGYSGLDVTCLKPYCFANCRNSRLLNWHNHRRKTVSCHDGFHVTYGVCGRHIL